MREAPSVLVADDRPSDIALIVGTLTRRGYTVITAPDGKEAIRAHAGYPGKIDLLVTDVDMAPMNGCELATLLITAQSDLRVLFVSGHVGGEVLRRKQHNPGELLLPKPFTSDELLCKVGEALHDHPPSRPGDSGLGVGWRAMVSRFLAFAAERLAKHMLVFGDGGRGHG
jgi:CheY-like chemotaxis protein